jgi:hypothetical protein
VASRDDAVQIRSYHVCFRLERRIHKFDRWRVPLPYGVPLAGLLYGVAALLAVIVLSRLPVTGWFLGTLHPWFRYAVIPGAIGWACTRWKIEGRALPAVGMALLRWRCSPRRIASFRPAPSLGPAVLEPITFAPDERGKRLRPGTIDGTGRVILRYPIAATANGNTLTVTQKSDTAMWRGKQIRLRPGQQVRIT